MSSSLHAHRSPGPRPPRSCSKVVLAGGLGTALAGSMIAAAALAGAAVPPANLAGLPASTILARATAGVRTAKTLVLAGTLRVGKADFSFNVATAERGSASRGDIVSRSTSLGFVGRLDFIERDDAVYLRAAAPFWSDEVAKGATALPAAERATVAHLLANRWVEMTGTTASSMRSSLGPLTDPSAFADTLLSRKGLGVLSKGPLTTYRRQRAVAVTSSKGGTIYVATAGRTRPLAIVAHAASGTGTILFGYPARVAVRPPAGAKTLSQIVASAASS